MKPIKKLISQKEIAERVHISPAFLSHILMGRKECPRKVAQLLQDTLGMDRELWVFGTPEEKRKALRKIMYHGL